MEQAAREKSERTEKPDKDDRRERVEGSQTLKSLYRVTQLIAQSPGEAALCPALADVCAMILNANLVYVLLRDPITDRLTKRGMYKHELEGDGGVSRSIIKTVLSKRKPLMTADAGADERFRSERSVVLSKIEAVIGVPILAREQVFGVIYIAHPKNGQQFRNEDLELATVVGIQLGLALENERAVAEVRSGLADTIRALVRIGEMAQPARAGHSERVARLAAAIAEQLGFDDTEGYWCVIAALLHDVGRVVDPSARTARDGHAHGQPETSIQRGLAVLETIHGIGLALPGIRHQYERWDGSGWPDGLSGEDIPRIARVLAVANAFDSASHYALSEHDQPMSREEAVEMVTAKSGKQFDAEVCTALAALAAEDRLGNTPAFLTTLFPSLNDSDGE
jgi:HD-GYP domain-containing protein (c-di-GMP phosphodiesterase class II)